MRMMRSSIYQQGVVLVIGLIMLLVMTLLAVTSMQSSSLQELMSNNTKDKMTAFEAAESAMRAAEEFLSTGVVNLNAFDADESDGLMANLYDEAWDGRDWSTNSVEVTDVVISDGTEDTKGGVRSAPRYVIQHIGPVNADSDSKINIDSSYQSNAADSQVEMFKITARGTGGSDNTQVILEAMYGVSN